MAKKGYIDLYKCREDFYNNVLSILSDDTTNDRANEIIDIFDNLPAADVQEVKHGKNTIECIPVDKFKCSECGFEIHGFSQPVHDIDGRCKFITECYFNYCPHCGARMDGKEVEK